MTDNVVRARGLPYSITKEQIAHFFVQSTLAGTLEESIQIVFNAEGRPSGECFVCFADLDGLQNALAMNNEHLGKRYIEVFHSDMDDMYRSMTRSNQGQGPMTEPTVKLRGIPYGASDEAITEFFSGLTVVKLEIPRKSNGECSGDGHVTFATLEEAEMALEKHMHKLEWRYIEVFKGSTMEMFGGTTRPKRTRPDSCPYNRPQGRGRGRLGCQSMLEDHNVAMAGGYNMPQIDSNKHKILMRGIPFSASEGDIIKFFAPTMPKMVEILSEEGSGRPSGQARVEFNSHEDAMDSMYKDNAYMDSRYIELFLESRPDPNAAGHLLPRQFAYPPKRPIPPPAFVDSVEAVESVESGLGGRKPLMLGAPKARNTPLPPLPSSFGRGMFGGVGGNRPVPDAIAVDYTQFTVSEQGVVDPYGVYGGVDYSGATYAVDPYAHAVQAYPEQYASTATMEQYVAAAAAYATGYQPPAPQGLHPSRQLQGGIQ